MSTVENRDTDVKEGSRDPKLEAIFATYDLCYFLNRGEELGYTEPQMESLFFDIGRAWMSQHSDVVYPDIKTLNFRELRISKDENEVTEGGRELSIEDLESWVKENFDYTEKYKFDDSELESLNSGV